MEPQARARTEQQDATRPPGGTVDTYEARTLEFMQHIWNLSDNYDRLHALASRVQPYPEDNYQRLSQLYTSVRDIIDELRHDCTQYTLVVGDWDALATEQLSEDSEWSRIMLQHRRSFFEDPAFIPKLLDEKQMDLLEYYCRLQHRIEDITRTRDATRYGGPPIPCGGHRTLSANEQQSTAIRLGQQPPPADTTDRHRSVNSDASSRRNVFGETLPPPIPMGWTTARGGARRTSQRPATDLVAGVAPFSGTATYLVACQSEKSEPHSASTQPAHPPQERMKAMMSTISSAAAERGPSKATSGPLQFGADGKPLSRSYADAKPPTSASRDADFGPENTSAFYRNATYQRSSTASSVQQPTWTLALKPLSIAPFDGDIRAYPTFRNHFLEIIEGQPGLEPRHKLQYLRGEPYRAASSYMITDANYFAVLDRLEETYGDRGTLVWQLNDMLSSLPPPSEDANDLRRFHDESAGLAAELRQSGENPDANSVLAQNLLSKLPCPIRLEVIRRADKNRPTVHVILEKLRDHLRVLEAANTMNFNANARGQPGRPCQGDPKSYSRNQPSSSQRYHNFMADARVLVAPCPLCSGPHWPSQCPRYDTAKKRIRRAQQLHFCFLCLRGSHRGEPCPKTTGEPCRRCGRGEHHKALCMNLPLPHMELPPLVSPTDLVGTKGDSRRVPMSANKTGPAMQNLLDASAAASRATNGVPRATNGVPTSPSRSVHQEVHFVTWLKPTPTGRATVQNLCPPIAQISSMTGLSNSMNNATTPTGT